MGRFLVIGGFEPSGHDSTAEALIEAGRARGHEIDEFRWRDHVDLADHPMFVSHRHAAARGVPDIAGMLDEDWIARVLSADLAPSIPDRYEAYLSVHPWSSMICAEALEASAASAPGLYDYHSDFGAFPVITHDRISGYLGGGRVRALSPRPRSRSHVVGVAAPRRFYEDSEASQRDEMLLVSAGSDGWAINAMIPAVSRLADRLTPSRIVLLAPSEEARLSWAAAGFEGAEIVTACTDISGLLKQARWYLSKGGGTAVAEGLVAGCIGFATPSGIFWEDEAAEHLHALGIVANVASDDPLATFNAANVESARRQCRDAADTIWAQVEAGMPPRTSPRERQILDSLVARVAQLGDNPLPRTTAALRARLEAWRDQWPERGT